MAPGRMQQFRSISFVVHVPLAVFLLAGCGGNNVVPGADAPGVDAPPPPGDVPRVEAGPCRFEVPSQLGRVEGEGYACGDLVVYEDREARGRTIRLHYIAFDSPAASANATIYLDGGPGDDGQAIIEYAAVLGTPFLDGLLVDGDFVVLGQRGTGRSVPFLDCQEPDCSDFSSMHDLRAYNTAANADDVDELRATLGYEKLNVYGISYGSRLGLEVLRRHGEHVRAAALEGIVPAQVAWPAAVPASFYAALSGLDASCAAAGACGAAFGDLRTKFSAGLASLDASPLPVTLLGTRFDLDGITYGYLLFQLFYSRATYPWLPLMISDVAERRADRIEEFLEAVLGSGESVPLGSTGLYNGVLCNEIFNPPDPDVFDELNADVPPDIVALMGDTWFGMMSLCASWPVASASLQAQLAEPVTSPVRTLVSSGQLDPITPPRFGDIVAATLSDAVVVVHASSGHGAMLQSACGTLNLQSFLAEPTTAHDLSCAASLSTSYVLPAAVASASLPVERIRAELRLAPMPLMVMERIRNVQRQLHR
jgi:pimeloyl-ACP methyl ester carboxylesterase